jgi:pimeloyl-ACP methyl ester carboxylesterase
VDRAILVGHSVGCMVAEQAAVRLGDRVVGLVMLGGALRWRPEAGPVFEQRVKLAREGRMDEIAQTVARTGLSERCRESNPALLGLFCELIASNDPEAYADWAAATAAAEMLEPERVACPALAACGELDPVTPPAFAAAIAAEMPAGRTAMIDGAAHWCHLEDPGAVSALLRGFLHEIAT